MDDVAVKSLVKELCGDDGREKEKEKEKAMMRVVELDSVGKKREIEWKRGKKDDASVMKVGRQKDEALFRRYARECFSEDNGVFFL